MAANTPILRQIPRSARLYSSARQFSTTRTAGAKSSPMFDLNGLAAARESQHLSKEQSIPRTEFMPTLQLIRSGEVDPFAPAPGSSIRGAAPGAAATTATAGAGAGAASTEAAAAHYNRSTNTWRNEAGPAEAASGVLGSIGSSIAAKASSSAEGSGFSHGFTERMGIALLFGSLAVGGLMVWGPDAWVVKPEHFNKFVDERVRPEKFGTWMSSGYGGQWMQFWDDKARTVTEKGSEKSQRLNLDQRAEQFDGIVRPRMEKLGSAIRGDSEK